jgi:hypothetical protein
MIVFDQMSGDISIVDNSVRDNDAIISVMIEVDEIRGAWQLENRWVPRFVRRRRGCDQRLPPTSNVGVEERISVVSLHITPLLFQSRQQAELIDWT